MLKNMSVRDGNALSRREVVTLWTLSPLPVAGTDRK